MLKRFHDLPHTFAQLMTDAGAPSGDHGAGHVEDARGVRPLLYHARQARRQAVEQLERHMAAERQRTTVVPLRKAGC